MTIQYTHHAVMKMIDKAVKQAKKESKEATVFAYQEGLKVGRAEVLQAVSDSTRNLNRKYGV